MEKTKLNGQNEMFASISKHEELDGKGCVLLDIATYDGLVTPANWITAMLAEDYKEAAGVRSIFDMSRMFPDNIKLNHRYPCSWYTTMSKRYKEQRNCLCSVGYPVVDDIEKLNSMKYLCVEATIKFVPFILIFPVEICLTEDKPYGFINVIVSKNNRFECGIEISADIFAGFKEDGSAKILKYHTPSLEGVDESELEPIDHDHTIGKFDKANSKNETGTIHLYKSNFKVIGMEWDKAIRPW